MAVEATELALPLADGPAIRLLLREPAASDTLLLVLPALGTPAKTYERFAGAAAAAGIATAVMELRGYGTSAVRAARNCDWGFRELLREDLPAAIAGLRARHPRHRLLLCGHSLGGHLAVALSALAPQSFDGIVLVACGSPWIGAYRGRTRLMIGLLTLLIPLLGGLCGYFPGNRIGFAGREARTLMRDWRRLATHNHYQAQGIEQDLEAGIAAYRGPVLALRMAEDAFAPEAAERAVTRKFRCAVLDSRVLQSGDLGARADHYGWCRKPQAAVEVIAAWIPGAP